MIYKDRSDFEFFSCLPLTEYDGEKLKEIDVSQFLDSDIEIDGLNVKDIQTHLSDELIAIWKKVKPLPMNPKPIRVTDNNGSLIKKR